MNVRMRWLNYELRYNLGIVKAREKLSFKKDTTFNRANSYSNRTVHKKTSRFIKEDSTKIMWNRKIR